MTFILNNLILLLIIFCALAGFSLALFIHYKKSKKERLVCLKGYHCDNVIWSQYSKILNIPLEEIGIIYYALTAIFFAGIIIFPFAFGKTLMLLEFIFSGSAFIMSLYLTYVQIMKLKEYCTWCLSSAFLSVCIFILYIYFFYFN